MPKGSLNAFMNAINNQIGALENASIESSTNVGNIGTAPQTITNCQLTDVCSQFGQDMLACNGYGCDFGQDDTTLYITVQKDDGAAVQYAVPLNELEPADGTAAEISDVLMSKILPDLT